MPVEQPSYLVIGVGHSYRGDDAVGPFVARALQDCGIPAIAHEGEGSGLLDIWEGLHTAVVVDAISGGNPGTIHRFGDNLDGIRQFRFVRSTHDLGLPEAVQLGKRFERMPARLEIIAICGSDFSVGDTMTAPVQAAALAVIGELSSPR